MPLAYVVMMSQLLTPVWEMRGHPLICLRTLLVFIHQQCMFIPVLVYDSFISWPLHLLLCQYSAPLPAVADGVLFCLDYWREAKSLDVGNAPGLFWFYRKCCSWYFTLFAVGRLQSPVLWPVSVGWFYSLGAGSLSCPCTSEYRQSQSRSSSSPPGVAASYK